MSLQRPYPYIYRPGKRYIWDYVEELMQTPEIRNHLHAYYILRDDLINVFEYIEPSDYNISTYSQKLYEILLRSCTEIESLCKLVFEKNGIELNKEGDIKRYSDLNCPMKLSDYEIKCYGYDISSFKPFGAFSEQKREDRSPIWYKEYNNVKHNRFMKFKSASLKNSIHALGGVFVMLCAQVTKSFEIVHGAIGGYTALIPKLFDIIQEPQWNNDEEYDFDWEVLKNDPTPYMLHTIPEID
jgi:hypothetical protein